MTPLLYLKIYRPRCYGLHPLQSKVDFVHIRCYALVMYLKKYNYYPIDSGGYVIMDDEHDEMLVSCYSLEIVREIVSALNNLEMENPNDVTKLH